MIKPTFLYPVWLWGLVLLPVLALLAWRAERRAAIALRTLISPRLRDSLLRTARPFVRRLQVGLQILAAGLAILALARPIAGYETRDVQTRGSDILLAVDTSRSMLAADVAPDRLTRARLVALDLVRLLPGDRLGLIAFAGSAFLQAPLTADHTAITDTVGELDAGIIPTGGSDLASAIRVAEDAFGNSEGQNRALVLFTDGEDLGDEGVQEAKRAAEKGIRIFTVGVGTPGGTVIQVKDESGRTEFVKDSSGQPVRSRLDSERLRQVAQAGSGVYYELSQGADIAPSLAGELGRLGKTDAASQKLSVPIDRFQIPLIGAVASLLISLLLNPRRRMPAAAREPGAPKPSKLPRMTKIPATALVCLVAAPAAFCSMPDPHALFAEGKYKEAEAAFRENAGDDARALYNAGTSAYAAKDYEEAVKGLGAAVAHADDPALKGSALYNLGNTLYQQAAQQKEPKPAIEGLKGAVKSYEQALQIDPTNKSTQKNLEIAQKMIEELEKLQKQQEEQKKEEEKKDEQKKDQKDQEKKDQEKKDDKGSKDPQDKGDEGKKDKPQEGKKEGDKKEQGSEKSDKEGDKGEPKEGEDGKKPDDKETAGKGDEKQDKGSGEEQKQDAGAQKSAQNQSGQEPPKEAAQPERDREGELQRLGDAQEKKDSAAEQAAATAAEEAQAMSDGKMTEAQARALLRSLQTEDQKVRLLNPNERRPRGGVIKDW